jgi:hypothetical protein
MDMSEEFDKSVSPTSIPEFDKSESSGLHHKFFTRNIFRTMVDEGTSTCVMYLECWKAICQPILYLSPTLLTAFNGYSFLPHGIIPSFPVQLGGKTMYVEVEVVDVFLDYNLLLGRTWTYAMQAVDVTIFWVLLFPHEGQIMSID